MTPFLRAYIACAIWSSTDDDGDPLDYQFDESDLAPDALESMADDCAAFEATHAADLAQAGDAEQNGHDFWLTRNGHGAGFWDRGYGDVGRRLTDAAHAYGTSDLYVGDDGQLHIM